MPPKQIIETTAASIINLKAQLAIEKEQFDSERQGLQKKKQTNKKTNWIKQNKGVEQRAKRDAEQHHRVISQDEQEAILKSQEALKRKAKLYESYQQQLSDNDYSDDENMLIDFTKKYMQEDQEKKKKEKKKDIYTKENEKEDEDESDPWVEYIDEFGRTRVVRQSQLPSAPSSPRSSSSISPPSSPSIKNPSFLGLADRTHIKHYNDVQEVRIKGVGHYSFAQDDEEERQRQMEALNKLRKETELARKQSRSSYERRKAILAKRAELIHQKRAFLRRKKQSNSNQSHDHQNHIPVVNEDSITNLLTTLRQQVRK
ncbi:unnamed protein product [Cunninghamella blakesleeana]